MATKQMNHILDFSKQSILKNRAYCTEYTIRIVS